MKNETGEVEVWNEVLYSLLKVSENNIFYIYGMQQFLLRNQYILFATKLYCIAASGTIPGKGLKQFTYEITVLVKITRVEPLLQQ